MLIRSKAPLRLGLGGGGTDVSPFSEQYGGVVLNATINMYAYCTIEELDGNEIIFCAVDRNAEYRSELTRYIELQGDTLLHKAVYNRIVKDYNKGNPLCIKVTTYSDAPAGSGLGSSSTMVVAILKAYVEYLNLPLGDYDVARLAYEIERVDANLLGGKQDQYAATFGGFNFIEFYKNDKVVVNPLRIKNWIKDEFESSLVVFNTGTSRESANIIEEQSRNVTEKKQKSIDALQCMKEDAYDMKAALLRGNIQEVATILNKSWECKKKTAGCISNPEIDRIYNMVIERGAYAGKVSGAGGGGFMVFIVDPVKRLNIINALNRECGRVFNVKFELEGTRGWRIV